jgi:Tol biopolymer transport system component
VVLVVSRDSTTTALKQLTRDGGLTTDPALSQDGRFLAYTSDRGGDGNLDIWVQLIAGGEPVRLTRDVADAREPNFSPDGSQIAFRSERDGGGIYVVSTLGSEPRLIAKRGHGPRFSPQGDSIAYWLGQTNEGDPAGSGTGELRIVPSAGGPSKQLCADFASAIHPVWSPDGKHILFKGARKKQPGVKDGGIVDWWITTPDGTSLVRTGIQQALSEVQSSFNTVETEATNFFQIVPSNWVADRIIFSARVGDSTNLWQMRLSLTGVIHGIPQRVTFGAGIEMAPSVDKAGHVVFANMSHKPTMWSLPIRSNTGTVLGSPTKLTSGAGPDISPSISEDGKRLAYATTRTGKTQLIIKDLESGRERILTEQGNGRSVISRDGLRLAYAISNREQTGLYVVNTMGGDAEKLCDDCARYWDWSPDGKKVAYIAHDHPPWRLGVYDVESHRSTYMLADSEYRIYEPRFSPNGRWLTFNARLGPDRTQGFAIDVFHASAMRKSDWVPVNDGRFWNEQPEWAPSGSLVYFESNRDGFLCIWAQHLDGTTKRVVGSPFAVYHSHRASLVLEDFSCPSLDKMILSLEENTSNIWMAELERVN